MATFTFFTLWKSTIATTANLKAPASGGDTFKFYLSNDAPVVATDTVKTDVTEISGTTNGYAQVAVVSTWVSNGSGGYSHRHNADVTWTQSGVSDMGPFQYVVEFDDTLTDPGTDPLVGYWNAGAPVTLAGGSGNSFMLDLDSNFAIFDLA